MVSTTTTFTSNRMCMTLSHYHALSNVILASRVSSRDLLISPTVIRFSSSKTPMGHLRSRLLSHGHRFRLCLVVRLFSLRPLVVIARSFRSCVANIVRSFGPRASPFVRALGAVISSLCGIKKSFRSRLLTVTGRRSCKQVTRQIITTSRCCARGLASVITRTVTSPTMASDHARTSSCIGQLRSIFGRTSLTLCLMRNISSNFSTRGFCLLHGRCRRPGFGIGTCITDGKISGGSLGRIRGVRLCGQLCR